jgi:two-component system phosphate regulon sensor histidine kinase PhoR
MQTLFNSLMDWCDAGVVLLDDDGRTLLSNTAARRMLGDRTMALHGRSITDDPFPKSWAEVFVDAQHSGELVRREVRRNGEMGLTVMLAVGKIPDPPGSPTRYLCIAHDITELRRLERVRRDFVANVSHELRTPLASIRAMAETLQDGALQDEDVSDRFLGTIVNEAQRLTRISEDLLVLSNAESRAPERSEFLLSDLLEQVVNRFLPQAGKAGIELTSQIPPGLKVLANHDQIEQVVVNLVDNGIKYTPAGGRVEVRASRTNGTVSVDVADNGIGIDPKDAARIFERFYRVDKARSRQSGGTGLGLSIVKHIVESHGGGVTLQSQYGQGSVFTFTLPVSQPATENTPAED